MMTEEELRDALLQTMLDAGLPEDSSRDLAFYVALHYPEHGAALIAARAGEPDVVEGS